jgi:hypothetical protein
MPRICVRPTFGLDPLGEPSKDVQRRFADELAIDKPAGDRADLASRGSTAI